MSTHIRNFSSVNFTARRILGFLRTAAAILAISGLCLIPTGCSDGSEAAAKGKSFLDEKNYEAATQFFREAADCGNAEAMCYLGACYYEGLGVGQDTDAALRWWHEAAEKGDAAAMLAIARCCYLGHGVSKDFNKAFSWIHSAANTEDPEAQFIFGEILLRGTLLFPDISTNIRDRDGSGTSPLVERDFAAAARMFRAAALRGHVTSMRLLALCYRNGLGVPKNDAEADRWLAKYAEAGGAKAMVFVGNAYAFSSLFNKALFPPNGRFSASELAEMRAALCLRSYNGRFSDDGEYDYASYFYCNDSYNSEKAGAWYLKAESAGAKLSAKQVLCVADFYYGNNKTEEAVEWYEKARREGAEFSSKQMLLVADYYYGNNKTEEAVEWYEKAKRNGAKLSAEQMLRLADFHYGENKTEEAGVWYEKAADAGAKLSAEQMLCLADFYYGNNNTEKAGMWYEEAEEAGAKLSAEQMLCLADFYYKGRNTEEAGKWYEKAEEAGAKLSAGQMLRLADFYYDYRKHRTEAVELYEKAEEAGAKLSADQMLRLADFYYRDTDTEKAGVWYEKAEEAGAKLSSTQIQRLHQCKNGE